MDQADHKLLVHGGDRPVKGAGVNRTMPASLKELDRLSPDLVHPGKRDGSIDSNECSDQVFIRRPPLLPTTTTEPMEQKGLCGAPHSRKDLARQKVQALSRWRGATRRANS